MIITSLDGQWSARQEGADITFDGLVPGCVHADLLRAGLIPDPNWRRNELDLQWIADAAWSYTRTFDVSAALLACTHVELVAQGLDTLAAITINGKSVACTDNMHRCWRFAVRDFLKAGANEVRITFSPVRPYLEEKAKIDPLPAWNEYLGWKHRGWIRKQHSAFGWDWAPVLVSCGIWQSIRLEGWSANRFENVRIAQRHSKRGVDLSIQAELALKNGAHIEGEVWFDGKQTGVFTKNRCLIENPQLWWPAGMGGQPLYEVRLRLVDSNGAVLDTWTRRIGLRTMRLVRKKDKVGVSFQFEANGIPFFAKGPNWVNPLPYPSYPEDGSWKQLLHDTVAVNCNMLRIWGGANFCPDELYDLCDEIGLTIWHDLMFACGPYPGFDKEFVASVEAETRDNIRRLRHHPSVALWCGNNELEPNFFAPERKPGKMSYAEYENLFHKVLGGTVETEDPEGNYWPSSPVATTGNRDGFDPTDGDIHIWEVWFSDAPFENYRNYPHRFISEFGFQGMPHPRTIESFTEPSDRQFNSPVLEHHQRSQPGNAQHLRQMLDWFRLPQSFEDQVFLSQLVQALCVKTGVEHFRCNMPRCMGTLYWQLNDCWPAPTWSSIDFHGRWKALHYFVRRFFAPVLISGLEDVSAGTVQISVSNDGQRAVEGLARIVATDLAGRKLAECEFAATIPAGTSKVITLFKAPADNPFDPEQTLVWLEWIADGKVVSENLVLLARPKRFELEDPELKITVKKAAGNSFRVTIATKKPALWAWLDAGEIDCRWSDNFRSLRAGSSWSVDAVPAKKVSLKEFQAALQMHHIGSTRATGS